MNDGMWIDLLLYSGFLISILISMWCWVKYVTLMRWLQSVELVVKREKEDEDVRLPFPLI